jgi:hypothetical protein
MPGSPFPGRPGGEHDEPLLDMIIARHVLPPDAPPVMHDLALMLAALAGPAEPGELAGEAAVRAAFSRAASPASISSTARWPVRRRRPRSSRGSVRSRARLATVMVAVVAGLGSVLAAYIDVLPSPIQQLAHVAVAAPAPPRAQPATLETARAARRTAHPVTSQPTPRPHRSPVTNAVSPAGQTPTPRTRYIPRPSASLSHRPPEAGCGPDPWQPTGPFGKPSGRPSWPSWSQVEHCTSVPAKPPAQPTLYPYLP